MGGLRAVSGLGALLCLKVVPTSLAVSLDGDTSILAFWQPMRA